MATVLAGVARITADWKNAPHGEQFAAPAVEMLPPASQADALHTKS